jgi:hypothetical protein
MHLDRATKWPGKGKAVEHAQQNVNAGIPGNSAVGRKLAPWIPSKYADLEQILGVLWKNGRNPPFWGFAGAAWPGHMARLPRKRTFDR